MELQEKLANQPKANWKKFRPWKNHRAESLESLEWLTGGDQSWGWSTSCPVRLWWFASVFQLTNRHVETRPVETPKQTREEPAPVIQGVSDEEVKRLGPLTRFSFDFNWSNVNSFVQRCSFLFAFLVSFCVTEATGRAREGPNDLNACYRCCFFCKFSSFLRTQSGNTFASWGLQSQNCRLGKANQRLGEWA